MGDGCVGWRQCWHAKSLFVHVSVLFDLFTSCVVQKSGCQLVDWNGAQQHRKPTTAYYLVRASDGVVVMIVQVALVALVVMGIVTPSIAVWRPF